LRSKHLYRQHPVKILGYTTKNFWLLSIPLIRGLISLQFDFKTWLEGAWLDISVVGLILGFAIIRWLGVTCEFCSSSLKIQKGVFYRQEIDVLYSNITSICIEKGLLLIPFRASQIFVDTNSGSHKKADIRLTLSSKNTMQMVALLKKFNENDTIKFAYYPSKKNLVFFSLVFSNTLSGAILISTLIYQGGDIVGRELENRFFETFNTVTKKLAFGLPPAAFALAGVILGGWSLSFLMNLMRHASFKAERKGQNLVVSSGFITKRTYLLSSAKINYTDFIQSLLTIIFKISSVHIHCSGYGKGKRAIAVLIPITTKNEAYGSLHMLLPNLSVPKISVRPTLGQITRFVFIPVLIIISIPIVAFVLILIFPNWREVIIFAGIIFEIPAVWLLIVKIVSKFTTGIGFYNDVLTLKYCKKYEFHTALVPFDKISMVQIIQSIPQKPTNNCNLKIFTNAEKTKSHFVKYLPFDRTLELLEAMNVQICD